MVNGAYAQSCAIDIEHILCNIYKCDRNGFGGIVDSDFVREQPFTAMACGLSFIYGTANEDKKKEIEGFITEYYFFRKMSLDLILSFETSTKEIEGILMEISFKNGKEAADSIIKDFRNVVKK